MTTAKTVVAVAGANAIAIEGTKATQSVVPFLDVPLWYLELSGTYTAVTPQVIIVVSTGFLSLVALLFTIVRRARP